MRHHYRHRVCHALNDSVGYFLISVVNAAGPVATELYDALTGVQQEKIEDSFGWVVPVA